MNTLASWSIPLAAIIIALGGALTSLFTYLRTCKREYIQDLEKRIENLELKVIDLIAERNELEHRVDGLVKERQQLMVEVLELRRRLNGIDHKD